MSGRRLLDLITLLNVSRNVAGKHIGIRSRQLDVHTRTSSLTKELKSQVDSLSRAAQAAAELAWRFNESAPSNPPREPSVERNASHESSDIVAREAEEPKQTSLDNNVVGTGTPKHEDTHVQETIRQPTREEVAWKEAEGTAERPSQTAEPSSTTPVGKSQNNGAQEEPSEQVVGQLFRSRRVGRSVFGQGSGLKPESLKSRSPVPGIPSNVNSSDIPSIHNIQPEPEPTTPSTSAPTKIIGENELLDEIPTIEQASKAVGPVDTLPEEAAYRMVESRVPSSRIGRLWEYGGLAASMAFGVVGESTRRLTGGNDGNAGSLLLSPANIERLVNKLSKMRGAALKLGQMMSFQGK